VVTGYLPCSWAGEHAVAGVAGALRVVHWLGPVRNLGEPRTRQVAAPRLLALVAPEFAVVAKGLQYTVLVLGIQLRCQPKELLAQELAPRWKSLLGPGRDSRPQQPGHTLSGPVGWIV
jgi:hypothetical protein